jgi:2-polyprenyl-6-hydroxyphenyl methylase/3-demethylubiquinone-9 3-methyltransferase
MKNLEDIAGYQYKHHGGLHSQSYLMPVVTSELKLHFASIEPKEERRVFDLGCGNGAAANEISQSGYMLSGVDPSTDGIQQAKEHFPHLDLRTGSAYDDLKATFGTFSAVVSLEVVEHVYDPRQYIQTLFSLVEPGGVAIISTPYHGYLKNLAIAVTGKFDKHVSPLWDHGHIKFWSIKSLTQLGFVPKLLFI